MLLDRQGGKSYMVGIDLRDESCQLSWCCREKDGTVSEPVTYAAPEQVSLTGSSLSDGETPGQFDIPTALAKRIGVNQWVHGTEAVRRAADASYTYIPHLPALALEGGTISMEGTDYAPDALLALFISRCLGDLSDLLADYRMSAVMFTSRRMDSRTIRLLDSVCRRLDVKCGIWYQSYADSYYDFMLNQPKELREPASALFEYEAGGKLRVCRLMFNVHTQPVVGYEEESEYPGLSAEDDAGRDEEFARIVRDELVGRNYAASYLIGSGFRGGWMRKSSRLLCGNGRRAFLGTNLYSKGAAYGAMFRAVKPAILSEYFFLDESKLRTNVLLDAYAHGAPQEVTLVEAGVNWYDVKGRVDLILEGTGEIRLILKSLTGGPAKPYHIRLEGLPVREGRITRIRVEFVMREQGVLTLNMTDLGFGESFPSSGLRWEQKVTV